MSMIDATTGLRAFLLFNIFIFLSIPPFGVVEYVSGSCAFKSYDSRHHIIHLQNKTTTKTTLYRQRIVWRNVKRGFVLQKWGFVR